MDKQLHSLKKHNSVCFLGIKNCSGLSTVLYIIQSRVQIMKEVISDLKRENQFFVKRDIIDISRERSCKPVLKLDFLSYGIMVSLSLSLSLSLSKFGLPFVQCTTCINIMECMVVHSSFST